MDIYHSYQAFRKALDAGETTCVDVLSHFLRQIEAKQSLNAFLEVFAEDAMAQAKAADARNANGTGTPIIKAMMRITKERTVNI